MTNAEKYLKEGVAEEFIKEINEGLDIAGGQFNIATFFKEQAKPTLTEDERVILRNMKNATHIKRDNGIKYIDKDEYIKTYYELPYSHLFQFIKERRRIFNRGVAR